MITIDGIDLYLSSYYYLPLIKSSKNNAYSSIDKYSEQASQGVSNSQNTQASSSAQEAQQTNSSSINNVLNDPSALIELLKLETPANKYAILSKLPHSDLSAFLFLLDKNDLLNGLKFFTKDKLLNFVYKLPKEQLLKMLFSMYISKDQILEQMPIKELNHFLSSKKIQKSNLLKIFQSLSPTELAQILEASTGVPQGKKSHNDLLEGFKNLSTYQMTDGIKGLEYKKMRELVSEMLKQDNTLYMEFTQNSLFERTVNFTKSSLIEGMGVLDNTQIIKYLDQLPDNLLSVVDTQIDTETFAQILVGSYQNLLSSILS